MPKNNPSFYKRQTGGQTKRSGKKDRLGNEIIVSAPGQKAAAPTGQFVQGRDASEIEKAVIAALAFQQIGNQLFVKPEGGKFIDAQSFVKQNPDFRPSVQGDLDQFQGAGLFKDFTLPVQEDAATTTTTVPPQQPLPQRAGGGSIPPTGGKDNPFGGLRLPSEMLIQQFIGGGEIGDVGFDLSGKNPLQPAGGGGGGARAGIGGLAPGGVVGAAVGAAGNIQADTGKLEGAAQASQDFNAFAGPLGQTAQGSLQNILATGNPSDTANVSATARKAAESGFQQEVGGINEKLGALGLGSSSARTGAIGRAATDLNLGLAAQEANLGFQGQEAAANRQLSGFSPFFQGSGQRLQGIGQAIGGFGQASGQQLQGQTAQAGAFGNLASTLVPPTTNVNQGPSTREINRSGRRRSQRENIVGSAPRTRPGRRSRGSSMGGLRGLRGRASGGRVKSGNPRGGGSSRADLGDFLGELTFGQRFERPNIPQERFDSDPVFIQAPPPRQVSLGSNPGSGGLTDRDLANIDERNRGIQQLKAAQDLANIQLNTENIRRGRPVDSSQLGQAFAQSRPTHGELLAGKALPTTARSIGTLANFLGPQVVGQNINSLIEGSFGRQTGGPVESPPDGGVIPGEAVPPDQVPILASGGEGIIPPDIMGALNSPEASTPEGAMAIVQAMRDIMDFIPGPRGPEDQGGRGGVEIGPEGPRGPVAAGSPPRGQTGMAIPTNQQRVGQFQGTPGTVSTGLGGGATIETTAGAPKFSLSGSTGTPPSVADVAEPRDFQREIQNAQARVDMFRALAIKDANRNTQLQQKLLPEAQAELDSLRQEFQLQQAAEAEATRAQAALTQAESQQSFAGSAVERAQIEAAGRAGRGGNTVEDRIAAQVGQEAPAGQQGQVDPQVQAILGQVQRGEFQQEHMDELFQTNPELAEAVLAALRAQQ